MSVTLARAPREAPTAPAQSPAQAISNGMVGLLRRYTGRGPTRASTSISSTFVLVSLHESLTRAEQNLVEAGKAELVVEMRRTFHGLIRDEASALIAANLGRPVSSQLADIDAEAGVAVIVFMLG